jgi:hypothetical protein
VRLESIRSPTTLIAKQSKSRIVAGGVEDDAVAKVGRRVGIKRTEEDFGSWFWMENESLAKWFCGYGERVHAGTRANMTPKRQRFV